MMEQMILAGSFTLPVTSCIAICDDLGKPDAIERHLAWGYSESRRHFCPLSKPSKRESSTTQGLWCWPRFRPFRLTGSQIAGR
jgi:hypothetical protein